jgi:prepilin-type N-terminal cleavage/methylation domain-containing protein
MRRRLRQRVAGEAGFTLTELLIVMVVLAILIAIAIPSYLGYRDRSIRATAWSNLRQAIPAAELYRNDNGTYSGMTRAGLLALNIGLAPTVEVAAASDSGYCLRATVSGQDWSISGPGATPADLESNPTCS